MDDSNNLNNPVGSVNPTNNPQDSNNPMGQGQYNQVDPAQNQAYQPMGGQPVAEQKDQNVYNFLIQIIQEKHGNDLPWEQITLEADKLYETLGDLLVGTFEPQMTDEHKKDFDNLVAQGYKQEDLQMYLLQNIPNLEQRIQQILVDFRNNYLNS